MYEINGCISSKKVPVLQPEKNILNFGTSAQSSSLETVQEKEQYNLTTTNIYFSSLIDITRSQET